MKRIASFVSALVLTTAVSATCSAMQFQQPVFIGSFTGIKDGPVSGERWIISKEVAVKKGSMTMGKGKTAIIFKYEDKKYNDFIQRDVKEVVSANGNVFPGGAWNWNNHRVYQIYGENGIVVYVDLEPSGTIESDTFLLRGLWHDGKAVNFVDRKAAVQYTGGVKNPVFRYDGKGIRVINDTICIPYELREELGWKFIKKGEFRFKWNEQAQWFGIEDFVY